MMHSLQGPVSKMSRSRLGLHSKRGKAITGGKWTNRYGLMEPVQSLASFNLQLSPPFERLPTKGPFTVVPTSARPAKRSGSTLSWLIGSQGQFIFTFDFYFSLMPPFLECWRHLSCESCSHTLHSLYYSSAFSSEQRLNLGIENVSIKWYLSL